MSTAQLVKNSIHYRTYLAGQRALTSHFSNGFQYPKDLLVIRKKENAYRFLLFSQSTLTEEEKVM